MWKAADAATWEAAVAREEAPTSFAAAARQLFVPSAAAATFASMAKSSLGSTALAVSVVSVTLATRASRPPSDFAPGADMPFSAPLLKAFETVILNAPVDPDDDAAGVLVMADVALLNLFFPLSLAELVCGRAGVDAMLRAREAAKQWAPDIRTRLVCLLAADLLDRNSRRHPQKLCSPVVAIGLFQTLLALRMIVGVADEFRTIRIPRSFDRAAVRCRSFCAADSTSSRGPSSRWWPARTRCSRRPALNRRQTLHVLPAARRR